MHELLLMGWLPDRGSRSPRLTMARKDDWRVVRAKEMGLVVTGVSLMDSEIERRRSKE